MLSLDNINEGRSTYMQISTRFLRFELDAGGGNAGFIQHGQEAGAVRGSDFWRLILDDGLRTEIPVRSSKQRGKVTMEGGALTVTPRRDDEECCAFDVTRCKFAELYKELGCADLGAVLSCERDAAFLEGFDESIELVRSETLMEGGSRCDFCYRKRG